MFTDFQKLSYNFYGAAICIKAVYSQNFQCKAVLGRHKSCMMKRQIRVKKLLVQLNVLIHVTQSKFNPYKREIVCFTYSYSAGGTCGHVLVHMHVHVESLPYAADWHLLPLLSNTLPIFNEVCRRSAKFILSCLCSRSALVRTVANYGNYWS